MYSCNQLQISDGKQATIHCYSRSEGPCARLSCGLTHIHVIQADYFDLILKRIFDGISWMEHKRPFCSQTNTACTQRNFFDFNISKFYLQVMQTTSKASTSVVPDLFETQLDKHHRTVRESQTLLQLMRASALILSSNHAYIRTTTSQHNFAASIFISQ